jgi:putative spermidine/putrescine transport system permease protein
MMRFAAWTAFLLGSLIFILPLVGMTEFSLSMRRGVYSFDAYASVLADPQFRETFTTPS